MIDVQSTLRKISPTLAMKKLLTILTLACLSNGAFAADLAPACAEYFKQLDQFVAASPQGEAMKAQYEAMKKQMADMPAASQESACKQASDAMKQALTSAPK